jgi:GTP:adenosylcobinamide-phosphate guanylyltransferase
MPDAVVLAGGEEQGPLAEATGRRHRPLIEVGGRLLVDRTLAALRGAAGVERIALVGPEAVRQAADASLFDAAAPAGADFADNIMRGAQALQAQGRLLVATADLPFLTPEALDDFVAQAQASGAALVYPIIRREACEARFPGGRRTYVRMRDGVFTGGNVVLADVAALRERRDFIMRLFGYRKRPARLARLLGLGFAAKLALGRLSVAQVERRGTELLGARLAAVVSEYPEIGFDLDKVADLEQARRLLAPGQPGS